MRPLGGEWTMVQAPARSLIVNLGDMLARWTNDRYMSTPHRVSAPPSSDRYSVPFFVNPDPTTTVSRLPACVSTERPCRYQPVTASEFLAQRIADGGYMRDKRRRTSVSAPADHRLALLRGLYGDAAASIEARATTRLATEPRRRTPEPTQADAWLIAYADSFQQPGVPPLVTLREVIDRYLAPEIDGVHVLPFHPASSDRGFSVVDYGAVEPAFGTWDDVAALAAGRRSWLTPCSTTCRPRADGSGRSSPASRRTTGSSVPSTPTPT